MQDIKRTNISFYVVCLVCALLAAGCTQAASKEEMSESVLKADSTFTETLQKKSKIDSQISQLKSQIQIEREAFKGKVDVLKNEFNAKKKLLSSEIGDLKDILNPQRERIKIEQNRLKLELKSYLTQHKNIESMSKDARKLLESDKGAELPDSEKREWQERLSNLSRQSKGLNENILQLKEKLRILKFKKHLLRH